MEETQQLVSYPDDMKDAICQVVRKDLEKLNIPFNVLNRMETTTSKKKAIKVEKSRSPAPTLQGGCCFSDRLDNVSHKELVEIAPNCCALVPRVLVHMIAFLDNHREAEGIFRISGTNRRLKLLRNSICQQRIVEDPSHPVNPHDVACLLKHFFRDIPGLLLTRECLNDMMTAAGRFENDDDSLAAVLLELCLLLPELNLSTLRFASTFFNRVATDCHRNKMPIDNLACVLTPNLMGPSGPGLVLTRQTRVVGLLLAHAWRIGFVPSAKAMEAQKMVRECPSSVPKPSDRQLRSASRKRSTDPAGQERKPLGTINNFVSSLASRLASTRRATISMSTAASRRMTLGGLSSSTQAERAALCSPRSTVPSNSHPDGDVAPASENVVQISCGKRRAPGLECPPAKVPSEGRFKMHGSRKRAVKANSLPEVEYRIPRNPSLSYVKPTLSNSIRRVPRSGASHSLDCGVPLAPELLHDRDQMTGYESPCESPKLSRGKAQQNMPHLSVTPAIHLQLAQPLGVAGNIGAKTSDKPVTRRQARIGHEEVEVTRRPQQASKTLSAPPMLPLGHKVRYSLDSSDSACLDISDISIHLPSLSDSFDSHGASTSSLLPGSPQISVHTVIDSLG
ncbi:uncharacterized protein LOC135814859 [Sycon ciliatum]|uniref:uncharacterized protein LOC135814859 n=1 Tax=Sycon ciliatum TaxID=27933 RepID=UPI0031F71B46